MARACCIIGNILIAIQLIRFIDRLVLNTNLLSTFYLVTSVIADAFIILTIIFSLIYVMIITNRIKKEGAIHGRLQ